MRLAFNSPLWRGGIRGHDLLILDEPTDGFAKDWLEHSGERLRTPDRKHLILVSHERELESCADHVFEVVKEGTVSKVESR